VFASTRASSKQGAGFAFLHSIVPTPKTEVVFTIASANDEPLARMVQEWLESQGIPAAIATLPFITALPNQQWGSVAVRAKDAPRARQLIQQFQRGEPLPTPPPKKAKRRKRQ
jgi:hypothetical protein